MILSPVAVLPSALAFAPLRVAGEQRGPQAAQNSDICVPDQGVPARCVPCLSCHSPDARSPRTERLPCQPGPAMLDWGDFLPELGLQGEFLCFVAALAERY